MNQMGQRRCQQGGQLKGIHHGWLGQELTTTRGRKISRGQQGRRWRSGRQWMLLQQRRRTSLLLLLLLLLLREFIVEIVHELFIGDRIVIFGLFLDGGGSRKLFVIIDTLTRFHIKGELGITL